MTQLYQTCRRNKCAHTNSEIPVDVRARVSYVNRFVSNGALRVKPGYVCSRVAEILGQPRFCALVWLGFGRVSVHPRSTCICMRHTYTHTNARLTYNASDAGPASERTDRAQAPHSCLSCSSFIRTHPSQRNAHFSILIFSTVRRISGRACLHARP